MKVYLVSMMNAFILMVFGLWSFIGSETPSMIALIPIMTGAFLLSLIHGLRYGSKTATNISMVLTSVILFALIVPFISALGHADSAAIYRIGFMMVSCSIAIGFFVSKMIKVRKRRVKIKG